jgi:hypothetical protein
LSFLRNRTPLAFALLRPSSVLARINSLSNSARPPRTVDTNRPCGVVVSAQWSASERKPAPAFPTASMTFSKSLVDRANSVRNRSTICFPGPLRLGHQSCCDCDSGHKDDEELEGQGVAAIWFNLLNRHEQYGGNDADAEDVNESQRRPRRRSLPA